MLTRKLSLTAAAVAALAVSVSAVAQTDEGNPPSGGQAQVSVVESRIADSMAVFGSARRSSDALPGEVAQRMDANAPFGLNTALSRRAIANTTSSVFVIPARGHVCASLTVGEGANLTCPTADAVAAGTAGAATVTLETGGIAIYGLVPDGVESVSVDAGGPGPVTVETSHNAYYTVVAAGTPLRSVGYAGPSGAVELPIHDPARAFEG